MTIGVGDFSPNTSILDDAILYAAGMGAKIIQMSLSVPQTSAIDAALQAAYQTYGVFIDCAAGNTGGGSVTYPANNQYVFAVTATDHNDLWATYSAKGHEVEVSAPGSNILSTVLNNSYGYASGTSMAAPHVAGIAALIWSANPNLTNTQVAEIIRQAADDKGTPGWDEYYGWGRVNAHQAVLLSLAYANKSHTNIHVPIAFNNNHLIERGYSGKLHKVFHSGGEIFYRRSSNNGVTWELTKRISTGNGANIIPSIVAGYNDVLCVVWQKEIDTHHYSIWSSFSLNGGTSWTTPAIVPGCSNVWISVNQSRDFWGPGPTPVVTSYFRGGSEGIASFLLVYAAEDGLHYRLADSYSTGWRIPASDIVPGSVGSYSVIWFPSLATYNSQALGANLIYGKRFPGTNNIYAQVFNDAYPDGSWANPVVIDWLGTYNRYPSLAIDFVGNTLGVWSGWNAARGIYTTRFRRGFSDGSWSNWAKEWVVTGVNSFHPSISYYNKGGNFPYGIDIIWHTSNNQIRQKKYYGNGDDWIPADSLASNILSEDGSYANITHERQTTQVPIQMWSNLSTQPLYSILYNSDFLPKGELVAESEIYRAADIINASNNSHLRIELSQPVITSSGNKKMKIPFKVYDYTANLNLTTLNVFEYLQTEIMNIPNTSESISFKVNIYSNQADTLSDGSINNNIQTPFKNVNFALTAKDSSSNILLNNIGVQTLSNNSGLHNFSNEFTLNASALWGRNISFVPAISLSGSFNNENLNFTLVNVAVEGILPSMEAIEIEISNTSSEEYALEQNYPNPFNPVTQIRYSVPQEGLVTLKIFDILGREVTTLVNEEKPAGEYSVDFNASSVNRQISSGVYFYSIIAGQFRMTRKMVLAK